MNEKEKTPLVVVRRLSNYRRHLEDLKNKGVDRVSSNELSTMLGYTASQIRQDLNNFGGFGQQGYGYNVSALYNEINAILGLDQTYRMVLVGSGNLGQAIANYAKYYKAGFIIVAMFDVNPKVIGMRINDIPVMDISELESYLEKNNIDIGIICTDRDNAQYAADIMSKGKVRGIWNFAPIDIEAPDDICVENCHISDTLQMLAYHMIETEALQDAYDSPASYEDK